LLLLFSSNFAIAIPCSKTHFPGYADRNNRLARRMYLIERGPLHPSDRTISSFSPTTLPEALVPLHWLHRWLLWSGYRFNSGRWLSKDGYLLAGRYVSGSNWLFMSEWRRHFAWCPVQYPLTAIKRNDIKSRKVAYSPPIYLYKSYNILIKRHLL